MIKKNIYFAAPLFNIAELTFNIELTEKIERLGYEVFLPQRDGFECKYFDHGKLKIRPNMPHIPADQREQEIFLLDRNKVFECDIFLFILDGRVPDEGACLELGLAYTHKYLGHKSDRIIVGLHTDSRAAFLQSKINAMVAGPLDRIFSEPHELLSFLENE